MVAMVLLHARVDFCLDPNAALIADYGLASNRKQKKPEQLWVRRRVGSFSYAASGGR
jgi:hypothetical protein